MTFEWSRRCFAPLVVAAVAIAATLACSSATTQGSRTATSRRVLLGDEIRSVSATSAHEAVQRLRPEWLRRRGQISIRDPSAGEVIVYLDGVRYGGPGSLQNIRAEMIMQMEFLDASDATTRFGTGHGGGAILVRTR
jgi:TonB-dependent receptor-like protein